MPQARSSPPLLPRLLEGSGDFPASALAAAALPARADPSLFLPSATNLTCPAGAAVAPLPLAAAGKGGGEPGE